MPALSLRRMDDPWYSHIKTMPIPMIAGGSQSLVIPKKIGSSGRTRIRVKT